MKKAACAAFCLVLKHCIRSATERTSATTTAASTAAAAAAITTSAPTTATTSALAATTCRQAVDAGACRVRLTASAAVAAARLIAARSKLIRHQGVDVAWQFVTVTARTAITTGRVAARWALITTGVKTAFWTTAFAGSFATFSAAVKAGSALRTATA